MKHASQTAEQMAAAYCDPALKKKREQIPFFFSAFLYMEINAAWSHFSRPHLLKKGGIRKKTVYSSGDDRTISF